MQSDFLDRVYECALC